MPQWTNQQQTAIDARDSSLIVSAAAGSGKTAVLTERLIKLIADPSSGIRADRMIVVTFTNDAAAELKKRLDMKLRTLINNDPGNAHLLKQQVLLQSAKISTINSFCFDLIRDNITQQGITSGFAVLDDIDSKVLKTQAMEELLDYYSNNEYEKISFLYDRFCIKNDEQLTEAISLADNFLASVAIRDRWLDKAVGEYKKDLTDSIYFKKMTKLCAANIKRALKISNRCLGSISKIFSDMKLPAAVKAYAQADEENQKIKKLLAIFEDGRFPTADEALEAVTFSSLVQTGKAEHNKEQRDIYKIRRDSFKKIIVSTIESISSVESDFAESGKVAEVLADVLRKYHELLWEKKVAKNALSFDDGERLALELLAEFDDEGRLVQSEIARKTAEYYDIIMIDEYQDSNNKQDLIFKLLSRNYMLSPEGEPMYGDNAFLVGDVKQSIYRFRLANPRNFIKTLRHSEPYTPESDCKNKAIVLNRNFRSSLGVINFVNHIFSQIMTESCGDVEYTDDEKLYFGAQSYAGAEPEMVATEISFINDDPTEEQEDSILPKKLRAKNNAEAEYTAARIAAMLKNGTKVIDGENSERPCKPSDFSILVRNNDFVRTYTEALKTWGVPVRGIEEAGYLTSREIAILLDLLRIINNPLLDVPMAAVMASPMYMFSIKEIAYIKSLDNGKPIFSVLRKLADGAYPECSDMFLISRCCDFLGALDGFRLDSVTMTVSELIGRIYDTTDFISVMQLQENGEKKRANLRALVQYASGYESSAAADGSGGLGGFLRHTDRIIASGENSKGKSSKSSGEYVSVQTLHGSKGLEYPFVFIAETSCPFKFDSKSVMCSDDGRIGFLLYDPKIFRKYKTFQQIMLADEGKADTRSEEMRLLYVGLTRAKQKLFINLKTGEKSLDKVDKLIGAVSLNGGEIDEAVSNADCFADWLWLSIMRLDEFYDISEKLRLAPETSIPLLPVSGKSLFSCTYADGAPEAEETDAEETVFAEADEDICRELSEIIGKSYDMSLSATPSRLTVTQIKQKFDGDDEQLDFRLKRPNFMSEHKTLTGAERGTAIHTFFQFCDFGNAQLSPEAEIARITEMGYITQIQAESIDVEKTAAFFNSELYRRICAAKNVWRERKFMAAISQLSIKNELPEAFRSSDGMIKGIIDLMFEEDDGIVLVDYKSDRGASEQRLAEHYGIQLRLYKSAIELITGKTVKEAYLYSFEMKKAITVDITQKSGS